jgi:hypothetical protein
MARSKTAAATSPQATRVPSTSQSTRRLPKAADRSGRKGGLRRWRQLRRGDRTALVVIAVLPLLAYGVPAVLGHPVLPGDDGSQNFPLRVLVGQQLRAGHLPVLALPLWSGSPLLAGWNAGAAYPFTWLFAILPATAAWAVNQMLVPWVAAGGLYLLLRTERLGPFPAGLGALTFAYVGAMDAQMVHFGLVAGVSWVPLDVLGVLQLGRAPSLRRGARWAALAGVAGALTILAGEPRAVDVAVAVVVPVACWSVLRAPDRRLGRLALVAAAGAVAGGLGAVQLVPGLHAVADSQRAATSYHLFDSGSYPLSWLLVLWEPNLLGGSGSFGAPSFLAGYNLTEVTGYVGVLPWVAAVSLLAGLGRGRRLPDWLIWEVVAAIGLVLALGGSTPAWHLLIHLPLYGSQRLQSRNVLVVDLALAVLLAVWADRWLSRPASAGRRAEVAAGSLVAVGVAGTGVASVVAGPALLRWLGVAASSARQAAALRPWWLPTLVLGAGALALVVRGPRLSVAGRRRLLAGFAVVDTVVFALTSLFAVWPSLGHRPRATPTVEAAADPLPGPTRPVADLHLPGRFAVYDPGLVDGTAVAAAGAPDHNLLVGGWSLQGYSSLVNGTYAAATGSHGALGQGQDELSVAAIADGTLDQLDPGPLVTPPSFVVSVDDHRLPGSGTPLPAPERPSGRRLAAGEQGSWTFGEPVDLTALALPVAASGSPAGAGAAAEFPGVSVEAITPAGRAVALDPEARWSEPSGGPGRSPGTVAVDFRPPTAVRAVGLEVRAAAPCVVGVPEVATASGLRLAVDGPLQDALDGGRWRYDGRDGPLSVYVATDPAPPLSLRPVRPGGSTAGVQIRAVAGPALAPSAAVVSVPPAVGPVGVGVVRAVAAISGWSARYTPVGGRTRTLPVRQLGLVQEVVVPPGRGEIRFIYRAPGLATGEWLGLGGLLLAAGLALASRGGRQPLVSGPDGDRR